MMKALVMAAPEKGGGNAEAEDGASKRWNTAANGKAKEAADQRSADHQERFSRVVTHGISPG